MSVVDSLLTALGAWGQRRNEERARVVVYLRKISTATIEFRDCLAQMRAGAPAGSWGRIRVDGPDGIQERTNLSVWVLRERAELIGEYYRGISGALGSTVRSEILDQLAEYLSRISIADNHPITHLTELYRRSSAQILVTGSPNREIDIDAPDFDGCLLELSTLSARITALADLIEAGADYR